MNKLMSYEVFKKFGPGGPPAAAVRMSRQTGDRMREALGLSAAAPVEAVAAALDALGRAARDQEAGRVLRPVQRGGVL